MTVKSILAEKGRDVVTISPDQTLGDAIRLLSERRIGAVVATRGDGRIPAILSERDIERMLAAKGAGALDMPVRAAMTSRVMTCTEASTIQEVMAIMTNGRFRHLPVEDGGVLAGIVSIGDVVKRRIHEVEREAQQIREYIATV